MIAPCRPDHCPLRLRAANDCGKGADQDVVAVIPSDEALRGPDAVQTIARFVLSLNCSRRKVPDVVADTIFSFGGTVMQIGKGPICHCGIDDVDAEINPNDEASQRWISDLMIAAVRRPLQRAQDRVIGRLRILAIAFAIRQARMNLTANDNDATPSPRSPANDNEML